MTQYINKYNYFIVFFLGLFLITIESSYAGTCDFLHISLGGQYSTKTATEPTDKTVAITRVQKSQIDDIEIKANLKIVGDDTVVGCPKSIVINFINPQANLSEVLAGGGVYHLSTYRKDARDNSSMCKYFMNDDFTYNKYTGDIEVAKNSLECNNVDWSQLTQISTE